MSNIWSPDPNSPVSAEAYGDVLPCMDLPLLGVDEASAPISPGCGSSFTSSRSALGTSPKTRCSRKKAEVYNVDTMNTTKPTKFVLELGQSAYVPRKTHTMYGAGRTKKAIVKKVRRPCLRCQRTRFVTTPLPRLRMTVICRLPLQVISGSIMLLPSTYRPLSS
jgi:hypothetical protein